MEHRPKWMYCFTFRTDWQYRTLNRNLLCGLAIRKVRKKTEAVFFHYVLVFICFVQNWQVEKIPPKIQIVRFQSIGLKKRWEFPLIIVGSGVMYSHRQWQTYLEQHFSSIFFWMKTPEPPHSPSPYVFYINNTRRIVLWNERADVTANPEKMG
jgi:hypothetical protein